MDKVIEWLGKLLKALAPAARRDPVTVALGALAIVAEIVTLSQWQYFVPAFLPWDFASPVLLLLFLWRQRRRSWTEASLALVVAVLLFAMIVFFVYLVPFKRLSVTLTEFLLTVILVVRNYP